MTHCHKTDKGPCLILVSCMPEVNGARQGLRRTRERPGVRVGDCDNRSVKFFLISLWASCTREPLILSRSANMFLVILDTLS